MKQCITAILAVLFVACGGSNEPELATSDLPDGGPDLCYCLQAISPDPSDAAACKEIIPENISPAEMAEQIANCSKR